MLARYCFQLIKRNGGIKIPFKGRNRLRSQFTPSRRPNSEALFGLFSAFSVIDSPCFLHQLPPLLLMIIPFAFGAALVPHVLALVNSAALLHDSLCIAQSHCSAQPP